MPTLLSVNNYFYRRDGSEVVYFEHNRLLEAAGWQVVPFAMQHSENEPSVYSNSFVQELEFGKDYSLLERLQRVPKFIYSTEAQRKLAELVASTQPALAHCHTVYHHLSPAILSTLKASGVPTVLTIHDLKLGCPAYHMHTGLRICEDCRGGNLRHVIRNRCVKGSVLYSSLVYLEARLHGMLGSYRDNVDRFISPCQFYIDKLVEWGWERERFCHIPNSLTPEDFRPRLGSGDRHVLYFGRLSVEKGLHTLIMAAKRAGVSLVLAGDGPQRAELEALAAQLDADVSFLGRLEPAVLADVVGRACATVLPSEWYENGPMSVLESFAWGVPVVGANIGGIPEMVQHGVNGLLFEAGSVDELADALCEVTQASDSRLIEWGRAARETLETRFASSLYLDRICALYAQLRGQDAHLAPEFLASR